jgi:cytochrome c oxidase accessory protein FixG
VSPGTQHDRNGEHMSDPDIIDVQEFAPAEVAELDLYQKREKIYTRKIEGFYQRLRVFTGWPLLLGYYCIPWISIDGRQAVWFDLPEREFHILGLTFWPQDFPLLAFLLIISAYTLFAVTVSAGRIWCGYTCPQTVWTSIFMWVEQKFEGTRNQRIKLDKQPWSVAKALRKWRQARHLAVHRLHDRPELCRLLLARARSCVRPGDLVQAASWQLIWTVFFTIATYVNAGWMREQVCKYMCPYARFQSVMFDPDTLIVSYDAGRGEPRGSRKRNAGSQGRRALGDCIDCELCVQVCPTGIDIRNGLQYECIGCALCIDACNSVMRKMGYEPGLVRYTSERELEGGKTHWLRPRIIGYIVMLTVMVSPYSLQRGHTHTGGADRDPRSQQPVRGDRRRRVSRTSTACNIVNMDEGARTTYVLSIDGIDRRGDPRRRRATMLDGGEVRR